MTRALVWVTQGGVGERFLGVSVLFRCATLGHCAWSRGCLLLRCSLLTVLVPLGAGALARRAHSALDLQVERAVSLLFVLVPVAAQDRTFPVNGSQNRSVTTWL